MELENTLRQARATLRISSARAASSSFFGALGSSVGLGSASVRLSCRIRGCARGGFIDASLTTHLHCCEQLAQLNERIEGNEGLPDCELGALGVQHPEGQYDASAIRALADDFVAGCDFGVGRHA